MSHQQWEYRDEDVEYSVRGPRIEDIREVLDRAGKDGWECFHMEQVRCGVTPDNPEGDRWERKLYFKRPLRHE